MSERERFAELVAATPLVTGSTGQLVSNPLVNQITLLTREIVHYEEHFGMTPLARMRLGIAIGEADEARVQIERRRATLEPVLVEIGGAVGDGHVIEVGA